MPIDSILNSVKKAIGFDSDYDVFDDDLIMHINSTFSVLNQLGIGPKDGFFIEDDSSVWSDFLDGPKPTLNMVKSYIYIKTKLQFDRPETSYAIQAMEKQASEYEWRLLVAMADLNNDT